MDKKVKVMSGIATAVIGAGISLFWDFTIHAMNMYMPKQERRSRDTRCFHRAISS